MKFSFYLHDLYYDIGHSNVTIDMINNLPDASKNSYHFIVYSADKPEKLFPKISQNISYHYLPIKNIKPALFKIIFYQLYTFFYSLFFDHKSKKVSLGISNFNSDICIVHFIHEQWSEIYFKMFKMSSLKLIYKKFFFAYLNFCERIYFKRKNLKIITVSNFMKDFIERRYNPKNLNCIHSGFDLNRYKASNIELSAITQKLKNTHPKLERVDFDKPICLFVGALERKGITKVLDLWDINDKNKELIIIGKSEVSKRDLTSLNITHIEHTDLIDDFYRVSDYFLFPTSYEPFGMVLIESAMHGLKVLTTKKNVGASEVLANLEDIIIYEDVDSFKIPNKLEKLSKDKKEQLVAQRLKCLEIYSWKSISQKYNDII